jgi:phage baseplate assembly protein V
MATYDTAKLAQQLARMIRYGNIHSVKASPPRCRVTFGTDPVSGDEHTTDWLPWSANADNSSSDWRMPAVGASVMVLSPGGNTTGGLVIPAGFTDDRSPPSAEPGQHVTRYSDGATVTYDTVAHTLTTSLPDGGKVIVIAAGGIKFQGDMEIDGSLKVTKDISDGVGTLKQVREVHDLHDHNENGDGGGVTDPPNQKMQKTQTEEEPDQ